MNSQSLWNEFRKKYKIDDITYQEWSFGVDSDELIELVIKGEKRATSSLYLFYELEGEDLPSPQRYSVIVNTRKEAICIIQTTKVSILPFYKVPEEHAYKEGEGDKTLMYWRKAHKKFFRKNF